jgi:hypothetical protein
MRFACTIGELEFSLIQNTNDDSNSIESESESESESMSESKSESESKRESEHESESKSMSESIIKTMDDSESMDGSKEKEVQNATSDLHPEEFSLLFKLGVHSNFLDKLLQELIRYNGRNTIEYLQGNNRPGHLVPPPPLQSSK